MMISRKGPLFVLPALLLAFATQVWATVYDVGPGQPYPTIGSVPWESLNAGDTINIHWQATPYREKFVLARVGTATAPITVHGVLGPSGERPILDGSGATTTSSNVLVESCYLYDNGNSGSIFHHNNYTESRGITFQFNRFGPVCAGCSGNGLKDRSSGLVIRYNWFEGAVNRQLDLVDAEDSSILRSDPNYHRAYVYGNVIIVDPLSGGNNDVVHFGGDSAGNGRGYRQ